MSRLGAYPRVLKFAYLTGYYDARAIFTWRSWLTIRQIRMLAQISFFALIGRMLHSQAATEYLLVGNTVFLATSSGVFSLNSALAERWGGTWQLVVASPSNAMVVFSARGFFYVLDGTATALVSFFIAAPIFGLALPWPTVLGIVPLVFIVAWSSFCFGTWLAGSIFAWRNISAVVNLTVQLLLMVMCGVDVPISALPRELAWIANALPLSHGLQAIRGILGGASARFVLNQTVLEVVVGFGWLGAALATFNRLAARGRVDGSLDLAR